MASPGQGISITPGISIQYQGISAGPGITAGPGISGSVPLPPSVLTNDAGTQVLTDDSGTNVLTP